MDWWLIFAILFVIIMLAITYGMMKLAAREDKLAEDIYRSIIDPRRDEEDVQ